MTAPKQAEKRLLREMRSGAYRHHYLVYDRKSTDEPDNQKNSLIYQREENIKFAQQAGLPVASLTLSGFCTGGVIAERHSGYKEDNDIAVNRSGMVQYRINRPKFKRLVQVLSKGYFKGVVCLCWDRMSRNKADDAIIAKLMRSGVDVRFALAKYDDTSAGLLHMDVDGMFAAHYSRVTSEKVRASLRSMRDQGYCVFKAPVGYLNTGDSSHKPFDPKRAKLVKRMFELYAEGDMSLSDIARWANEHGLTTPPIRPRRTEEEMLDDGRNLEDVPKVERPISANFVHRTLTNPFYMGRVRDTHGAYIKSRSHKALVSEKMFRTIQTKLSSKRVSIHYDEKIDLPFRGLVRCEHCRHAYSPYRTKGNLYLGVRCKLGCPNALKNCRLDTVAKKIGDLFVGLLFKEEELSLIEARTSTDVALFEQERHQKLAELDRKKRKVREDLKYLRENKLALLQGGVFDAQGLVAEENKLNALLISLQEKEQASDASMHETMKDVQKLSELLKSAHSCYISANSQEKEQFLRMVFSELTLSENTLNYRCKKGFRVFENRFVASGGDLARLSELSYLGEVRESIVALEKLLKKG